MNDNVIITTPEELEEYLKYFATKEYRKPFLEWQKEREYLARCKMQEEIKQKWITKVNEMQDELKRWGLQLETGSESNDDWHEVEFFNVFIKVRPSKE